MSTIPRSFYSKDTVEVAQNLLGKKLVRKIRNSTISGIITETEAYRYKDDPASHAFRGTTERNKVMFEQVGRAYVYFTYGMHYCVNVVARSKEFEAGAVLIRGLKPLEGIEIMKKNRKTKEINNLTNGPAKLTQAMNITKKQNAEDLVNSPNLYITQGVKTEKVQSGSRIGIKNGLNHLWNFKAQF